MGRAALLFMCILPAGKKQDDLLLDREVVKSLP
jgi:hypothetical protein